MKIAVFSDIHSNVYALEEVIAHAQKQNADILLNLGDIFYGPMSPRKTFELLMTHEMKSICGNQDRQIVEASPEEIASNATLRFVLEDLGGEALDWIRTLPFDLQLDDDIYLCHGTPTDDLTYLLEDVATGAPVVRSDSAILELLQGQASPLILCGHSHMPRTVQLSSQQTVVNPGSVGLPAYTDDEDVLVFHAMENHSPHASYALIEKTELGWTVQHNRIPYDHERSAEQAQQQKRDDWAHFIRSGRK